MFRRPILSRIGKILIFPNLCRPENGKRSLVSSKKILPGKEHVVSYLMNSCGLTREKAVSASCRLHFDSPDKANSVLRFLEKHGFSKTQIAEVVSRRPLFLQSNPEKTFLPKIEFFLHRIGMSETDTVETIVKHPGYLGRSLEKHLAPVYQYLEDTVGSRKAVILLRRGSRIFDCGLDKKLMGNLGLLTELGVPKSSIEFALYHYPDVVGLRHESFEKIVSEVQGMGFNPLKTAFVMALRSRTGKGNRGLWERCYEAYRSWGWSEDDIYMAYRRHPHCMLLSEKKISRFMDFWVNKMGRDSRSVARVPYIIFYSMEKRIIPRHSVLYHLFVNGFVKENWSLASVLCPPEAKFLENYVQRYSKDLPQLLHIYKGKTVTSGGV